VELLAELSGLCSIVTAVAQEDVVGIGHPRAFRGDSCWSVGKSYPAAIADGASELMTHVAAPLSQREEGCRPALAPTWHFVRPRSGIPAVCVLSTPYREYGELAIFRLSSSHERIELRVG
jgi:hypothetical protein